MFIMGFLWKRTTATAAMFAIVGGFAMSVFFKFLPGLVDLSFLHSSGFAVINPSSGLYEIPFLDRMAFVFVGCIVGMAVLSLLSKTPSTSTIEIDPTMFRTSRTFAIGAVVVLGVLAVLYGMYW
jgi:SSS family solute:Na+ symporter